MARKSEQKSEQKKDEEVRVPVGFGLGGILDGIQKLVETAAKLKESGGVSQSGEFSVPGLGEKGKGIFGFSIRTMAEDDNQGVQVRPLGNMHKAKGGGDHPGGQGTRGGCPG